MDRENQIVYSKDVIEFVTVAAEYCGFIEQAQQKGCHEFVSTLLKILPLLYLKGELLPMVEPVADGMIEESVTEDDYEFVRTSSACVLGAHDDYLDVFLEDMKYSVEPIRKCISEDLADIYQDLRNFICVYRNGYEEAMNDALYAIRENFAHYWGQTLVNTQRALHDVLYNQEFDDEEYDDKKT